MPIQRRLLVVGRSLSVEALSEGVKPVCRALLLAMPFSIGLCPLRHGLQNSTEAILVCLAPMLTSTARVMTGLHGKFVSWTERRSSTCSTLGLFDRILLGSSWSHGIRILSHFFIPYIAFSYVFLVHFLLRLPPFLSEKKKERTYCNVLTGGKVSGKV